MSGQRQLHVQPEHPLSVVFGGLDVGGVPMPAFNVDDVGIGTHVAIIEMEFFHH